MAIGSCPRSSPDWTTTNVAETVTETGVGYRLSGE